MLAQLYIKNIAVIQEAAIEFGPAFNVFTGETGAGKTMLISAINGVLGERLSKDIIRTGEEKAYISALFSHIPPAARLQIEEKGYDLPEGELLISRELGARNSCKINGRPATLQILKEIASLLIDIHGQKDSHRLLDPAYHMEYIDSFGGLEEPLSAYQEQYRRTVELRKKLAGLSKNDREKQQRLDLLHYQIQEIQSARLEPGEEEELLALREKIRNSERIVKLAAASKQLVDGGEDLDGISAMAASLGDNLNALAAFLPELKEAAEQVTEFSYLIGDIGSQVSRYLEDMDFDPGALEAAEDRLDTIRTLKRKYGATVEEVLAHLEQCRSQLEDLSFSQEKIQALQEQLSLEIPKLQQLADQLTAQRHKAAREFLSQVKRELEFLNMPSVKLTVSAGRGECRSNGQDELEFLLSTNAGEPPKPLAKTASGGELSRVMLAIKNVLAEKDQVGTAIFDEVDTGVSGKAAQKIGQKLREVSKNRQVICVTHLAPVAAFANTHLYIHKEVEEGRTFTRVDLLEPAQRAEEIARIVSGDNITDTARKNAEEMILLASGVDNGK